MVEGFVETGLRGRDMCASGEGETSGNVGGKGEGMGRCYKVRGDVRSRQVA